MVPALLIVVLGLMLMMFGLCTSFYKAGYMEAYEVGFVVGSCVPHDVEAETAFNVYYDQMHGKHFAGIKHGWLF